MPVQDDWLFLVPVLLILLLMGRKPMTPIHRITPKKRPIWEIILLLVTCIVLIVLTVLMFMTIDRL